MYHGAVYRRDDMTHEHVVRSHRREHRYPCYRYDEQQ